MNLLQFWGKAQPSNAESGPQWHPLAYHSLDVAAVGGALMSAACGYESCFARLLQISRQEARSLVCYLLALHDIGKFAKKFQAKVSGLYPDCFNGQPANVVTGYDHGAGGLRLFNADTAAFRLPENTSASNWRPLISAVAGHHGAPPDFDLGEEFVLVRRDFGAEGIRAAREFLHKLHALLVPPNYQC